MSEQPDQDLQRLDGAGPLPLNARRALWDRLWLRLLAPPTVPPNDVTFDPEGPADIAFGRHGALQPPRNRVAARDDSRDGHHHE